MAKRYTDDEVIAALLSAPTVTEAAKTLGCSTKTIYNYTREEGFKEAYDQAVEWRETMLADLLNTATAQAIQRLQLILEADSTGILPDATVAEQLDAAAILLCRKRGVCAYRVRS